MDLRSYSHCMDHEGNIYESLLNILLSAGTSQYVLLVRFIYQITGRRLSLASIAVLSILWGLYKIAKQAYAKAWPFPGIELFTCTVHICGNDDIYKQFLKWLSIWPEIANSRSLMAQTETKTAWEAEQDLKASFATAMGSLDFSRQEAKVTQYIPSFGDHYFLFKHRCFRLRRTQKGTGREDLYISCLGRSPGTDTLLSSQVSLLIEWRFETRSSTCFELRKTSTIATAIFRLSSEYQRKPGGIGSGVERRGA